MNPYHTFILRTALTDNIPFSGQSIHCLCQRSGCDTHHEEFHHEMIAQIKSQLTEQETPILIYALAKLADYFHLVYKGEKE